MPNAQSVLVHRRSRNLIIAFNKNLQIWRYEKDEVSLKSGLLTSHLPHKQTIQQVDGVGIKELAEFDLPVPEHLKRDFLPDVANERRKHEGVLNDFFKAVAAE